MATEIKKPPLQIAWSNPRLWLALAALAVLGLTYLPGPGRLEQGAYALGSRLLPPPPTPSGVVVVAIDEGSLASLGGWPWPRTRLAAGIDRLVAAEARAIALALPLTEAQSNYLGAVAEPREDMNEEERARWRDWAARLDTDRSLVEAIARAGNVYIAAEYGGGRGEPPRRLPALRVDEAEAGVSAWLTRAPDMEHAVRAPLPGFIQAARGVGLVAPVPGTAWPLAVATASGVYPSLHVLLAAHAQGVPPQDLRAAPGRGILFGEALTFPAPGDFLHFPIPGSLGIEIEPVTLPFADLLSGKHPPDLLKGRIAIVGLTAPGLGAEFTTPGGDTLGTVTGLAHATAQVIERRGHHAPAPYYGVQRLALLAVLAYLILLPPRFYGRVGLITGGLLALLLVNSSLVVLFARGLWLPLATATVFLVAAQALLALYRAGEKSVSSLRNEATEARLALARNLHSQGSLDHALIEYQRCAPEPKLAEPLYELAVEYERRRQFVKSARTLEFLVSFAPDFRDARERLGKMREIGDPTGIVGRGSSTALVVDVPGLEKPVLGRYRLDRQLGRGAMGIVYLGTDPKINRKVAIKVLSLGDEYQGEVRREMEQRFLREAAAAGRLRHPNMVTVYDVGEEHDLLYIAMDYVEGDTLDAHTDKGKLLPPAEVLDIGAQIASALGYAHRNKVVHRDIKPGNILYDRAVRNAKVTDFGIARLLDDTQTRTGVVLGSPSYMSPEQINGAKIDGRSDIYSLGVTLFQLLTGSLPFQGETFAELMRRITQDKAPMVSKLRPELPSAVSRAISKCLQKTPNQRYDDGDALAVALRRASGSL